MKHDNQAVSSVSNAILTGEEFNSIPDPVAALPTDTTGPLADTDVGKLACISSNETDGSAAIVWARWTDENLANALGSNVTQESSAPDSDRIRYRTATSSAARLADTAFVVGDHETVRSVIDVWHHGGDVVSEGALAPFERTDRNALVRFATQFLPERDGTRPRQYDRIENGSTALKSVDAGTKLTIEYQVDSIDSAPTVESALEDDLVESPHPPSAVGLEVDVGRTADVIHVSCEADESTVSDSGADLITAARKAVEGV